MIMHYHILYQQEQCISTDDLTINRNVSSSLFRWNFDQVDQQDFSLPNSFHKKRKFPSEFAQLSKKKNVSAFYRMHDGYKQIQFYSFKTRTKTTTSLFGFFEDYSAFFGSSKCSKFNLVKTKFLVGF